MNQETTDNNASRKRPALHHDHHDNHRDSGSPNHNNAAELAVATAAGHEDHDGIDFQTDHHHHHNVNDQYDQHHHHHQHQHHMDDDRSQQSESNDHHCLDVEPNHIATAAAATRSNSFIALPSAVLEHILIYLPCSYIGLLPMLCTSLHSEIGTQSPALWRNLILREGWTEPKNVQAESITLYKSFFLSHDRICQRVEALKMGVTKLLTPDKDVNVSRGIALGALDEIQGDLDPSEMLMNVWDDHSVLIVSQMDCVVHLHQVSTQTSSDDKCVREIMQVRLAPVPISDGFDCTLTKMAIGDHYVLFAFFVDDGLLGFSVLASIMKDELLSNSTEDTIECGDCLKKHELSLMVKDFYDRNPDHNHSRFLSDLLERQNFENKLAFYVIDLIDVGHGIFCVLVNIYHRYFERDEEGFHIELENHLFDALLSFSASNGGERILDCIHIPRTNDITGSLSPNMEWPHRSDPVEIICNIRSFDDRTVETMVVNMDRSGVFHRTRFMIPCRSTSNLYLSHTLRTPSRLVRYSRGEGVLDVYDMEDDLLSENLPLTTEFNTVLSMNHLGNDYVMMLCRRDAISAPADEDIDDQRNVYCLYFIVIHISSMEEIYVSRITSIEKVDMMVAIGKDCTIVAAVQGIGCCFSSRHV
eukprot:scaffold845_cov274-Chaetoceros_neogracile.AAC.18